VIKWTLDTSHIELEELLKRTLDTPNIGLQEALKRALDTSHIEIQEVLQGTLDTLHVSSQERLKWIRTHHMCERGSNETDYGYVAKFIRVFSRQLYSYLYFKASNNVLRYWAVETLRDLQSTSRCFDSGLKYKANTISMLMHQIICAFFD
jgi:hypothetical protein